MVGLCDSVLALDFDLAAAARLLERERAATRAVTEDLGGESFSGRRARSVNW